jgi:hypothetical protein
MSGPALVILIRYTFGVAIVDNLRSHEILRFQKMDKNKDGVVTLDEFLECCRKDEDISSSMAVFDSSI